MKFYNLSNQTIYITVPLTWQKDAQLSLEEHVELMDRTCLWIWLKPKLAAEIDGSLMHKYEELWQNGFLGWKIWGRVQKQVENLETFR